MNVHQSHGIYPAINWEFRTDHFLYDSFSTSLACTDRVVTQTSNIFTKPRNPPNKLPLVSLLAFLREILHVVSDMLAEDMGPVDISIERLALAVVSWEPLLRVGDVKSSINSSLQGSENLNRIIVKI